jgi:hypothetical protein
MTAMVHAKNFFFMVKNDLHKQSFLILTRETALFKAETKNTAGRRAFQKKTRSRRFPEI